MSEILTLDQLNNQLIGWGDTLKEPLWYKEVMPVLIDFLGGVASKSSNQDFKRPGL